MLEGKILEFINLGKVPFVISFSSMPLKSPDLFKEKLVKALKETDNRAIIIAGNSGIAFEREKEILTIKALMLGNKSARYGASLPAFYFL